MKIENKGNYDSIEKKLPYIKLSNIKDSETLADVIGTGFYDIPLINPNNEKYVLLNKAIEAVESMLKFENDSIVIQDRIIDTKKVDSVLVDRETVEFMYKALRYYKLLFLSEYSDAVNEEYELLYNDLLWIEDYVE